MRLPLMLCLSACAGDAMPVEAAVSHAAAPLDRAALPGASLYHLDTPLLDQEGRELDLAVFAGQPVLVSMFYASCTSACPMLVNDVRRLEDALTPEERARTRVLLVSIDPETDTPTALAEAAARYGVDLGRWRLTAPRASDVRTIAAALGISYQAIENGEFHHSSLITLLDPQGVPLARLEGLKQNPEPLLTALRALEGPPR